MPPDRWRVPARRLLWVSASPSPASNKPGGAVDVVAAAARPADGIAHLRWETARAGPRATCSPCFIWSRSGIGNSVNRNLAPAHRCQCLESTMRIWQLHDFLRRTYSSARVNQNWIGLASFRLRRFRGTLPPASLYERVDRSTSRWRHRRRNGSEALDHPRRGNCDPRLHNYL